MKLFNILEYMNIVMCLQQIQKQTQVYVLYVTIIQKSCKNQYMEGNDDEDF